MRPVSHPPKPHSSPRRKPLLRLIPGIVLATVPAALLLVTYGCGSGSRTIGVPTGSGGSSGGSGNTLLEGNAAHRAAVMTGYHAFSAGIAYPLNALELVSPNGSALRTKGKAAMLAAATKSQSASMLSFARLSSVWASASAKTTYAALGRATRQESSGITYVEGLNLYTKDPVYAGNVITIPFYTDAAGAQSAGSLTMTLPVGIDSTSTTYPAYPFKIALVVNITAGNLPCNGNISINFNSASGANTLTGTLTLPKDPVTFNINLGLDENLNVSGSITGQENGATINLTNCSGSVFGNLTCDVEVDPYGWKGTATGSLLTGQFTSSVNTSTGTNAATVDADGNLDITYPDGTKATITDPVVASLIAGQGTIFPTPAPTPTPVGTPTPVPTPTPMPGPTSVYSAPVSLALINPTAINNAGQILAANAADNTPVFLASAGAAPTPVTSGYGIIFPYTVYSALTMNNSGQIVEYSESVSGIFLNNPTAAAQTPAGTGMPEIYAINDAGTFVGGLAGTYSQQPTVWTDPNTPVALTPLVNYGYQVALGISPDGQIVGFADNSSAAVPIYWASKNATPQLLAVPASYAGAPSEMGINKSGQIFATVRDAMANPDHTTVYYWSSPTAMAQVLTTPSGSAMDQAFGINASGQIIGSTHNAATELIAGQGNSSEHALLWQNGQVTDLNTLIPSGTYWTLNSATAINDSGAIVGIGTLTGAGITQGETLAYEILLTGATKRAVIRPTATRVAKAK